MADSNIWKKDLEVAREVFQMEADALGLVARALNSESFGRAVDLLYGCQSQVVITGMGKSGHIGVKVAATMASTGTPAFFMHPGEALHGDLGVLTSKNVAIAISQGGASDEVLNIIPYIKRLGIPLIVMTGRPQSQIGEKADVILSTAIEQEACPLNLAPTTSTTMQLVMGDALAIALMKRRGFTPDDYAIRHPLGALGRRLLIHVSDVMQSGDANPIVHKLAPLPEAMRVLERKRLGAVSIVDDEGRLVGIFTDGDFSRLFTRLEGVFDMTAPIERFMIKTPKFLTPDTLGAKAVDLMETHKITAMPIVDADHKPIGMIHEHDLVRIGITP